MKKLILSFFVLAYLSIGAIAQAYDDRIRIEPTKAVCKANFFYYDSTLGKLIVCTTRTTQVQIGPGEGEGGGAITSVFGRTGVIVATSNDYSFGQIAGVLTDAQVPNNITIDLSTVATTANAGDSATGFFPAGTIESARLITGAVTASRCLRTNGSGQIEVHSGDCGGGGSVPGANTQVIFNDGGAYGADAGFVYDKTLNAVTADNFIATSGYSNFTTQSDSTTTGDWWRNGDLLKFRSSLGTETHATFFKGANVASAGTITPSGNTFVVTGSTGITAISTTGSVEGRILHVVCGVGATAQITDGAALLLNGNFTCTDNDVLTVVLIGSNWHEVSRSAN